MIGVLRDAAVIDAMRWHGDCDTVFHVINRSSGEATKVVYTSESFFFLHTINAYEEVGSSTGCDILFEKDIEIFVMAWNYKFKFLGKAHYKTTKLNDN